MADKDYNLFFGGRYENCLQIKLIGLHEDVTCIAVVLMRCGSYTLEFERFWMINLRDFESKTWVTERCLDKQGKIRLFVYGLKPILNTHQAGELFQVLDIGSLERPSLNDHHPPLTGLKEIRFSGPKRSHQLILDTSLVTTKGLKLKKSLNLPDTYKLHMPTGHLSRDSDIALFIEKDGVMEYLLLTKARYSTFTIPTPVSSRQTYGCAFVELNRGYQSYTCHGVAKQNVFIVMTKEELLKLKQKAEDYLTRKSLGTHEVKIMFRNKPKEVFDKIMDENNGLMEKYIKDNNGDRYSPVNGYIDGLFFSVSMTEKLPYSSYFGDWRLHVPIEALFAENTNIYFTDFYCHYDDPHYVTVVLTIPGSETDTFCRKTLLLLDQMENPFLFREDAKVRTTKSLHVEVLYTEDVDIQELQRRYNTGRDELVYFGSTISYGESTPGGIVKRQSCSVCNL